MMQFLFLTALAFVATMVNAQAPPPCVVTCATLACGVLTNLECLCVTNATALYTCEIGIRNCQESLYFVSNLVVRLSFRQTIEFDDCHYGSCI
jgi:hypothetical protein